MFRGVGVRRVWETNGAKRQGGKEEWGRKGGGGVVDALGLRAGWNSWVWWDLDGCSKSSSTGVGWPKSAFLGLDRVGNWNAFTERLSG